MHVTPPPLDLKRFVWRPGTCRGRCLTKQYVLCLWHHCLDPNWERTSPFCLQYCLKSSLLFSCKLFFTTFAHKQCLSNELVDCFKVLFGQPVSVRAGNPRSAVVVCLRQPTQHCSAPYRRITGSYVENNFPAKIVVD